MNEGEAGIFTWPFLVDRVVSLTLKSPRNLRSNRLFFDSYVAE